MQISFNYLAAQDEGHFGSKDYTKSGLVGILYDLKQYTDGMPTGYDNPQYWNKVSEFLENDWNESTLDPYIRTSRSVYASRLFIPSMNSNKAPLAFGVEDSIQAPRWLIHYKGQVRVPEDGIYSICGFADDLLVVRVNGEIVLLTRWSGRKPSDPWSSATATGFCIHNFGQHYKCGQHMVYGDPIAFKAGEIIDLDILLADHGGRFAAWLYVLKKGEDYSRLQGSPVPPILQFSKEPVSIDESSPYMPPQSWSVWQAIP